jgi:hypothetical protein
MRIEQFEVIDSRISTQMLKVLDVEKQVCILSSSKFVRRLMGYYSWLIHVGLTDPGMRSTIWGLLISKTGRKSRRKRFGLFPGNCPRLMDSFLIHQTPADL